jgi:selenocysteine-specific elongation factor
MELTQKNITLGTAGHIDHGKTALIKCLTGCDTDRLKAEKERGMSIDLGFAPCRLADLEVGIVDVPGHENFIKTMVAGASGIDAAIFVVAADDGVMPQTREHLDILRLLGVSHGLVALTKVDCVSEDRVAEATSEVRAYVQGTFLEGAPILPVSSITGQGFGEFYDALKELVVSLEPKQTEGIFRLPVERTFSIKGYGTVVSGIPVSGSARVGDKVMLFPSETPGRIKAIQVYQKTGETVQCGQCAALNVSPWDQKTIARGDVVTVKGFFKSSRWYLCQLSLLTLENLQLKNGASVKFHTGTSEAVGTVFLMEGSRAYAGQDCLIQIKLSHALVAGPADRFILRSMSPVRTMGGGMIVEALDKKLKRSHDGVKEDAEQRALAVRHPRDFVEYCIRVAQDYAVSAKQLALRVKLPIAQVQAYTDEMLQAAKLVSLDSALFMHSDTALGLGEQLLGRVGKHHQDEPASPGIDMELLQRASELPKAVFHGLIAMLESRQEIKNTESRVALAAHQTSFDPVQEEQFRSIEALFQQDAFKPPKPQDVSTRLGIAPHETQKLLTLLVEHGRLVRIDRDMYFLTQAIAQARTFIIDHLKEEGRLESVQFKYLLNTTRKYAIPLLDYFDKIGVTRRAPDNTRYAGPNQK